MVDIRTSPRLISGDSDQPVLFSPEPRNRKKSGILPHSLRADLSGFCQCHVWCSVWFNHSTGNKRHHSYKLFVSGPGTPDLWPIWLNPRTAPSQLSTHNEKLPNSRVLGLSHECCKGSNMGPTEHTLKCLQSSARSYKWSHTAELIHAHPSLHYSTAATITLHAQVMYPEACHVDCVCALWGYYCSMIKPRPWQRLINGCSGASKSFLTTLRLSFHCIIELLETEMVLVGFYTFCL